MIFSRCIRVSCVVGSALFHIRKLHFTGVQKNMCRLFEDKNQAQSYAQHRPTYPPAVYNIITSYVKERGGKYEQAVDICCGSGQGTQPLSEHFKKVLGTDISEVQIQQAKIKYPQLDFEVKPAEEFTCFSSGQVDLITCAQGFHWVDHPKFYAEAGKVLSEAGVVAAYGYGNVVLDRQEAQDLLTAFYSGTLKGYWESNRAHVEDHYSTIQSHFQEAFQEFQRNDDLVIKREMSVDSFIGYMRSWSAYISYMQNDPKSKVLEELHTKLREIYSDNSDIKPTWPVFILMGTKKMQ